MPSILCKCGERLGYGAIPNPIEHLYIADVDFDAFAGPVDAEALHAAMRSVLNCPSCKRLWIFHRGFGEAPMCYRSDDA